MVNDKRSGAIFVTLLLVTTIVIILSMSVGNLLIPVGFAYAIGFMILTWHRLDIALGIVLVLAPWVQDVSGGGGFAKFSAAEVHIFMIALVKLCKAVLDHRLFTIGHLTVPVLLYMGLMGVSAYQGGIEREDIIALMQTGIFCYLLPALYLNSKLSINAQRNVLILAACSTVFLGCFQILAGPRVFAVGMHKNNMGMSMAAGFSLWVTMWFDNTKGWWSKLVIPAFAIVSIAMIFTLSRGAWVGGLLALLVTSLMYRRFKVFFRVCVLLIPMLAVMWAFLPKDDQEYAVGFDRQRHGNINDRFSNLEKCRLLILQSPYIGHGISVRKQMDATNLVMVTLAEGGVVGLTLFVFVLGLYFRLVVRIVRELPQSDPRFFIVTVSIALMVSRLGHAQFDHYWVRGASTMAWASVGMVLAVERSLGASRRRISLRFTESVQSERLIV